MLNKILLTMIFVFLYHSTALAAKPALRIEPQTVEVEKDEQFSIRVAVEDVTELFGASFSITFDGELLETVDATAGDFLGEDVIFLSMPSSGKISLAITKKKGSKTAVGSGTLAEVKFKAIAGGETDIVFNSKTLSIQQADGSSIPQFADLVIGKSRVTISIGLAMRIVPSVKKANINEEFTVDVVVENAINLFSTSFDLSFDDSVLKVTDAVAGDFLGADVIFSRTHTSGKINISISKKAGDKPASGSGVLAKVTFIARKAGALEIEINRDTLRLQQANGSPIAGFGQLVLEKNSTTIVMMAVDPKGKLLTAWSRIKVRY